MCQEVEQREEDAGGLLYSQEPIKRPFAMILDDRFEVGWISGQTFIGDDVLADIITFCWACPKEKASL